MLQLVAAGMGRRAPVAQALEPWLRCHVRREAKRKGGEGTALSVGSRRQAETPRRRPASHKCLELDVASLAAGDRQTLAKPRPVV